MHTTRNIYLHETLDLDAALTIIGYGKFHCKIMIACALCFISSGVQYGLTAYAMPAAQCELNLTSLQIGLINSSFLIGAIFSSFLWGVLADLKGRKKVLITTLLLNVVMTVCCALSQSVNEIIVFRFINGFLAGASGSVSFSYMAEFHAPLHRTRTIHYAGVFFTVPWLILPALAWWVLTLNIEVIVNDFILISPWRIFLMLLVTPELIGGLWLIHLPETPKFLSTINQEEAVQVLQKMYEINNKRRKEDFPVNFVSQNAQIQVNLKSNNNEFKKVVIKIVRQIFSLFETPLWISTALVTSIMFSNMFGYFGLGLWLPQVLVRKHENLNNSTITSTDLPNTCLLNFGQDLYRNTVIVGISAILANIFAGWLSGKVNNKVIPITTLMMGAICSAWIFWVDDEIQYLIASCIFQSSLSVANIAIGTVAVDMFPTNVNAIGICTTMLSGRLGAIFSNMVFGFVIDENPAIPIFLIVSILMFGSIMCFFIPSSKKTEKQKINDPIFCITKKITMFH
ncbi:hypothetical protein FQR65_LT12494 [Abscondita terminalis]|nr:hypothetical protein FQR65_LT12494 [Abscondita terminalis]